MAAEKRNVGADRVRQWARENGYEVGTRGHLAQTVIDEFNRANWRRRVRFDNTNPMVSRDRQAS